MSDRKKEKRESPDCRAINDFLREVCELEKRWERDCQNAKNKAYTNRAKAKAKAKAKAP